MKETEKIKKSEIRFGFCFMEEAKMREETQEVRVCVCVGGDRRMGSLRDCEWRKVK